MDDGDVGIDREMWEGGGGVGVVAVIEPLLREVYEKNTVQSQGAIRDLEMGRH